jgi:alpha-ketoglutarate-dependent taurine dioxygenase
MEEHHSKVLLRQAGHHQDQDQEDNCHRVDRLVRHQAHRVEAE